MNARSPTTAAKQAEKAVELLEIVTWADDRLAAKTSFRRLLRDSGYSKTVLERFVVVLNTIPFPNISDLWSVAYSTLPEFDPLFCAKDEVDVTQLTDVELAEIATELKSKQERLDDEITRIDSEIDEFQYEIDELNEEADPLREKSEEVEGFADEVEMEINHREDIATDLV